MKGKLSIQTFVTAFSLAAVTASALAAAEETGAQLRTQAKVSKSDARKRQRSGKSRTEAWNPLNWRKSTVSSSGHSISQSRTRKTLLTSRFDAKIGRIAATAEETPKDQAEERES
jgi:hypothetical protein